MTFSETCVKFMDTKSTKSRLILKKFLKNFGKNFDLEKFTPPKK